MSYRGRGTRGHRGRRGRGSWGSPPIPPSEILDKAHGFYPLIRPIFDWTEVDEHFPQAPTVLDNTLLEKLLEEHAVGLGPSREARDEIMSFLNKLCTIIDNMIVSGEGDSMLLDEVRLVGAHKMEIAEASDKVGEIVVILKDLPTPALTSKLSSTILECLEADITDNKDSEPVTLRIETDTSFEFRTVSNYVAKIYLTSLGEVVFDGPRRNRMITNLTPFEDALRMIRQSKWWEDQTLHMKGACDLSRILLDMKRYVPGLNYLTDWHIQLLSQCAMIPLMDNAPLSLVGGFRRVWELLSAGLFLPGSSGIPDPCEVGELGVHDGLPLNHLDELARNAQMILQMISFGAYRELLAMEGAKPINFQEPYIFGEVTLEVPVPVFDTSRDILPFSGQFHNN